jgi:hypothetical protein
MCLNVTQKKTLNEDPLMTTAVEPDVAAMQSALASLYLAPFVFLTVSPSPRLPHKCDSLPIICIKNSLL